MIPVYTAVGLNVLNLAVTLYGQFTQRDVTLVSLTLGLLTLGVLFIWARWLLWL